MIRAFKDRRAQAIFNGQQPGKGFPPDLVRVTRRKLVMIAEARTIYDLRVLPGNRVEALKGDRVGQHAIRINNQFRVCFVWVDGAAEAVEIVDYH